MSKGYKGKKANAAPKTTTTVPQVQSGASLATPETASPDIGEHYYHAAGERAPAGQYENTTSAITDHVYGKGYKEAAESVKAGYDVLPSIPLAPTLEDITSNKLEAAPVKRSVNTFDVFGYDDSDEEDEDDSNNMKSEEDASGKPSELDEAIALQMLATLMASTYTSRPRGTLQLGRPT